MTVRHGGLFCGGDHPYLVVDGDEIAVIRNGRAEWERDGLVLPADPRDQAVGVLAYLARLAKAGGLPYVH